MAELAPSGGGGPNRLFVILAVGLGALLILGLIGVGGIFLLQRLSGPAPAPTAISVATTPTRALTATAIASATSISPTEQPTPTFVIITAGATDTPVIAGAVTTTRAAPTSSSGQLPRSGRGEDMLMLAGGVVLVLIVFVARRARVSGRA